MTTIINPNEFGIEEQKANELIGYLPQIKSERAVLEKQFSEIISLDIEDIETSKKARELRLLIAKNRTQGINVWHKTTKDYFLKGGQFVDAIKRMEIAVNEKMEADLEQIEKYAEIKEQKRLDEILEKRIEISEPFKDFIPYGVNLRIISDEDFEKLLNGAKLLHKAKIEEEEKAEKERIENLRLDNLERERQIQIAPYVQFLNSTSSLREMSDEDYITLLNNLLVAKNEFDKEQENIRIENERLKKEAEEKELQQKIAQLKAEEKLKAEHDARLKIEKELQEKKDAELKAEQERLSEIKRKEQEAKKLLKAGEKQQLNAWIESFGSIEIPSHLKQSETANEILSKYWSFKNWAKTQIENI